MASFLKLFDKQTVEALEAMQKMKDPEVRILRPKHYKWNNKKWDIIILIRENAKDENKIR